MKIVDHNFCIALLSNGIEYKRTFAVEEKK